MESEYYFADPITFKNLKSYLAVVSAYMNADSTFLKESVEKHFLFLHSKSHLPENQFGITFFPKKNGVQVGFICHVKNGTQSTVYYIKTHQNGPTSGNPQSHAPPDLKEAFIYMLLHHIGMGPETHLIFPEATKKTTMIIATKECDLMLLSNLVEKSASFKALLQLDLISRILCLRDCATNPSNCGLVGDKPMIVDFRIKGQPDYFKPDILEKFYDGNGEFHYLGLMQSIIKIPKQEKFAIMKESLKEWDLAAAIDKTVLEVKETSPSALPNDLPLFVENVKATLKILTEAPNT